jgi:CheY-like chemotaxis protein
MGLREMKVLILEDDPQQQLAMKGCLADRFPMYEVAFSATADKMRRAIAKHLDHTLLIALDHELELIEADDGRFLESGTGREVADELAKRPPICPVVIHSTNSPAAIGMQMVLDDADWETHRVLPLGTLEWIPTVWFRVVRDAIVGALEGIVPPIRE